MFDLQVSGQIDQSGLVFDMLRLHTFFEARRCQIPILGSGRGAERQAPPTKCWRHVRTKDIEEHLFYPLVTNRAAGTGLGLSISQLLVQRHEGLIEYRRHNKTERTEFTILLPYLND